jgi:two-component system, LytTR family, response regulator
MKIKTLIVDDEAPGRVVLRNYIAKHADLELVGEAEDGAAAVRMIEDLRPRLVFLDVQMPDLDGFGVIQAVGPEHMPATIFVTAYDQYALRAFDANAVGYLLKPFDMVRFERALRHAREAVIAREHGTAGAQLLALVNSVRAAQPRPERFVVRSGGRVTFLALDEIDWIEASANYVRIHAGTEVHQIRESITHIAERLDPSCFVRVHRSVIVNFKKVRELQACNSGEYIVVLKNGKELPCSRTYRTVLEALFR